MWTVVYAWWTPVGFKPSIANFFHADFYGKPIILETEADQEFLGFLLEFEPACPLLLVKHDPALLRVSIFQPFN